MVRASAATSRPARLYCSAVILRALTRSAICIKAHRRGRSGICCSNAAWRTVPGMFCCVSWMSCWSCFASPSLRVCVRPLTKFWSRSVSRWLRFSFCRSTRARSRSVLIICGTFSMGRVMNFGMSVGVSAVFAASEPCIVEAGGCVAAVSARPACERATCSVL